MVKDHTKARCHVDCFASLIKIDILTAILTSVSIDILKLVTALRFGWISGVMVCWLSNSSEPRTTSHELFTCLVLYFEEIAILAITLGLLVVIAPSAAIIEFSGYTHRVRVSCAA